MNKRTANAPKTPLIGKMAYTTRNWRKCHIWTRNERGVGETQADVIGACAVHAVTCGNVTRYQMWHVSHIPTGRVIVARELEQDARVIAEALAVVDGLNTAHVSQVKRRIGRVIGA